LNQKLNDLREASQGKITRHLGRDKSATAVRKCAVSEADETQKLKPLTWIPEMSLRVLNAKMKCNMKHAVVMVLQGTYDRTLHALVA
jgi:hypothetical protein